MKLQSVLLHGWGVSNTVWNGFAESLCDFKTARATCLYETAINTKDYGFESMAAVLSNSIKTDTVLVAWSMGGLVATPLAKLTNKIKAIVFVASAPCFVNKKDWTNVIDMKGIDNLQTELSKNTKETLEYFSGLVAHGDSLAKETNKEIRNNLSDEKYKAILSSWLMQMKEVDQRIMISNLDLPVQVILGQNDSLINSKIESQLKLLNPGIDTCVINDCGHAPFISKRQQTANIINEFINAKFS